MCAHTHIQTHVHTHTPNKVSLMAGEVAHRLRALVCSLRVPGFSSEHPPPVSHPSQYSSRESDAFS